MLLQDVRETPIKFDQSTASTVNYPCSRGGIDHANQIGQAHWYDELCSHSGKQWRLMTACGDVRIIEDTF